MQAALMYAWCAKSMGYFVHCALRDQMRKQTLGGRTSRFLRIRCRRASGNGADQRRCCELLLGRQQQLPRNYCAAGCEWDSDAAALLLVEARRLRHGVVYTGDAQRGAVQAGTVGERMGSG